MTAWTRPGSADTRTRPPAPGTGVIAKFDLRLIFAEAGRAACVGPVEYSAALFDAATDRADGAVTC